MRQSRTSGSVGGLGGNSQAYPTALGRRVEKVVTGGATTRYILDGVQVVEEFDGSNVWQARYVYEDGIDQPRCMDRADVADVNGNSNTTEVLRFHYHQQALGSVTEMTQPTGAVVEWVTYDVYGQPLILNQNGGSISQSAVGNPYLYTGREFDPESGLFFYRARQYDPGTGRFLQRDPAGYIDGLNLLHYASSSPTVLSDALGLDSNRPSNDQYRTAGKNIKKALAVIRENGPQWAQDLLAELWPEGTDGRPDLRKIKDPAFVSVVFRDGGTVLGRTKAVEPRAKDGRRCVPKSYILKIRLEVALLEEGGGLR